MGKTSWRKLLEYYAAANVLYAQPKSGDAFASAEPSKLFECFSMGKPVIYGGQGLGAAVAGKFDNAHVIPPDDPHRLAPKIKDLWDMKPKRSDADIRRVGESYVREAIFKSQLMEAGLL